MLGPLLSRCRGAVGSPRQRAIVMVLRHLNMRGRRPEQTLCLRCRPNGGRVVLSKEAGLQLADPIIAGGNRQTRIALEVLFEPAFVELGIGETAERGRQPPERPDQPELAGHNGDDETESRLAHEGEPGLGFSLYFLERVATDEQMRDQGLERIARPDEVTAFLRRVEGAAYKRAAGAHGPRPGIDELPEAPVDASLETVQPPLLHQSQAELAEAEPRLVIAELQSQDCAEPDIGEARAVAVAMLQAEVRHAA